jgi:hypothetical protein
MPKVRHRAKVRLTGFSRKNNNLGRTVTDCDGQDTVFRIFVRVRDARSRMCREALYPKKCWNIASQSVTGCLVAAAQGFL